MAGRRTIAHAAVADVWDVLCDGWLYPVFVVGAARMRSVDEGWPAVGTRLHHSVGSWPLVLDDTTTVVRCEPERLLRMTARGWPAGEAKITFTLSPSGHGTEVVLEEDVVRGAGLAVPRVLRRAAMDLRNTETLNRLDFLARGRAGRAGGPAGEQPT